MNSGPLSDRMCAGGPRVTNSSAILDEREGVGRVDTWSEYLCVSRTHDPDKFEIAICRYEMVGEIPTDWFDDEGQPLPKYSDDTGCLKVPEYYEHRYAGQIVRVRRQNI